MERTILHCDLNSFFASVELLERPELRDFPVAVCGDPEQRHGVILAKNEAAKQYKVQTAETIWQAQRKCPGLVLLPAHHKKYQHYSQVVHHIYEQYTDLVEAFGIDESWLDISGSMHLFGGDGRGVADQIRARVKAETGLSISVGVSFNKIFAKLGSDLKKPDATSVITRASVPALVWPLPVTDLLFVGKAAAKTLGQYGVHTIGQLAAFGRGPLITLLGKQGGLLYDYATGAENSPVAPSDAYAPPKSVGNGLTFRRDLLGAEELRTQVALLSDSVAMRLRKCGLRCGTVQVNIRDPNFQNISRQKGLRVPSCTAREISQAAMELILSAWSMALPVRAITVTAQNLLPEEELTEQLDLFSPGEAPKRKKQEQLERAMDGIREKYGNGAILSAAAMDGEEAN